jgi:hypothetical protein
MSNTYRCEMCGMENDDKPTIIRFSYTLLDGSPAVELIYLCWGCGNSLPKTNPTRRQQLVQLFQSLYPNKPIKLE